MAKTSKDARKDIEELQEFITSVKSVSQKMMEDFLERHRRKSYIRTTLKRYKQRGLIENKGSKLVITAKGLKKLKRKILRRKTLHGGRNKKQWDGKWRLITFDVPIKYRKERDLLRSLLREFGFYQLQKSVWVCPNYMSEELWKFLVDYELDKFCRVMLVEFLEGDEDIKKHFFGF